MNIIKRSGKETQYDETKIVNAIRKANNSVAEEFRISEEKIDLIVKKINSYANKTGRAMTVEEIQDKVEEELVKAKAYLVSKNYITFRYKKSLMRKSNALDAKILTLVDNKNEEVKQENANKNPTVAATQRDYIAGELSRDITNRILLPKDVVEAHNKGIIHFHDADYFVNHIFNCCLVNIEDMLQNGTVISKTKIEKPHSFHTACNITSQIIAQIASNQYGGQSFTLAHLAPFVDISREKFKKTTIDELSTEYDISEESAKSTIKELNDSDDIYTKNVKFGTEYIHSFVKDGERAFLKLMPIPYEKYLEVVEKKVKTDIKNGIQTLQFQTLTLSSCNGQSPFVTFFMYLNEAKNEHEKRDLAYIIEEVLKQRIQGVKNEAGAWISPAFPKLIYVLQEDNVEEGQKYYYLTKLAAECSAKRLVPDYISEKVMKRLKVDEKGEGYCFTPMGCRSFLSPFRDHVSEDGKEAEELWNKLVSDGEKISDWKEYEKCTAGKIIPSKPITKNIPGLNGIKKDFVVDSVEKEGDNYKVNYSCPQYIGRFNQGVVSINLPYVALLAEKNIEKFWKVLDEKLEICHRALRCRHERLLGTLSDTSPIHWQHGAIARLQPHEKIDKLLFGNYSTISLGYVGLWECVYALCGKKLNEEGGEELGLKIMDVLNSYTNKWKDAENIGYSLYGTPAESLVYKFAKAIQKDFGVIEGVSDRTYITNSYHINVKEEVDAFYKIEEESKFQEKSPGGAISYIETANLCNNVEAIIAVIKHIYEHIMYAEINTYSDYCSECGYDGEISLVKNKNGKLIWKCPNCGNTDTMKMNIVRRVCGYLSSANDVNQGRLGDIHDRVRHL